MKLRANCKINLGLDVVRRREDGYHDLVMVMLPVRGFADELTVEIAGESDHIEIDFKGEGLTVDCTAADNLCVRSATKFMERYGVTGRVVITLDKVVPFGAGLGGGSSDAAAVIVAMNELFKVGCSSKEMEQLASEIGCDAPLFIENKPRLCLERGDVMEPLREGWYEEFLAGRWIAIIKPDDCSVSTKEAYSMVRPMQPAVSLREAIERPIEQWQGVIKNDFERSVFAIHPALADIKKQLIAAGAIYASMSGSGSAIYGIFNNEREANNQALKALRPYIFPL